MHTKIALLAVLFLAFECRGEEPLKEGTRLKKETDLKEAASSRYLEIGYPGGTPASVYGAPGGSGFIPSSGYSSYNGYSGLGGYLGSSLTAPGYTYSNFLGNGGYNGGYTGGYNNGYTGGYNSGYNSLGGGYFGNGYGGYGGYGGNGGYASYNGYNNGYYPGYNQGNLGYGYYKGGNYPLGSSSYYNRGYSGYYGVTPSFVSGYRGYTK